MPPPPFYPLHLSTNQTSELPPPTHDENMFSNNRRQPANRPKPVLTTVTASASTSTAPAPTGGLPNGGPAQPRPPPLQKQAPTTIKVTTVKTKVQAPARPTRPTQLGATGSSWSGLKRKATDGGTSTPSTKRSHDSNGTTTNSRPSSKSPQPKTSAASTSKAGSASRARPSAAPRIKSRSRLASPDSDAPRNRRGTTATIESSSEDEGLGIFARRDSTAVVKRDVSATEDGRVNAISAADLVENARSRYEQRKQASSSLELLLSVLSLWLTSCCGSCADFVDLSEPTRTPLDWAGAADPQVTLEYPGEGAQEK